MTAVGLLERVKAATGPDKDINLALREIDAEAFVKTRGWKLAHIGPDYDGANACDIWTPDGKLVEGFDYPRRGRINPYYHVYGQLGDMAYTASIDASMGLAERLKPSAWWSILNEAVTEFGRTAFPSSRLPLAILAALLTALIQSTPSDGGPADA